MSGKFKSPPKQIILFKYSKMMELIVEQRVSIDIHSYCLVVYKQRLGLQIDYSNEYGMLQFHLRLRG